MKIHRVNAMGLEMIRQELLSKCKPSVFDGWLDDDLIDSKRSKEMIGEWASVIEDDLNASNGYFVQLDSHQTKSGHFEHLEIDDSGIDVIFNEVTA